MPEISKIRIKVKNYKAFGAEEQGLESISNINIVIGKNNTGKSALLDIVEYCTHPHDLASKRKDGTVPEVYISYPLTLEDIHGVFTENRSRSPVGVTDYAYFTNWENRYITHRIDPDKTNYHSIENGRDDKPVNPAFNSDIPRLAKNPLQGIICRRILADRDIVPESSNSIDLTPNGSMATAMIHNILDLDTENADLINSDLLNALNKILEPDIHISKIHPRKNSNGNHEIFLQDSKKGLIRLIDSGSGLKTIMLVLLNLIVMPKRDGKSLENYIFCFEELENNLHPGALRRLFSFIREVAETEKAHFFITTHSSIVIDMFSGDPLAQILHVTHDGENSVIKQVQSYSDQGLLLDDLDVRASDLLQSNGVIWVEGPSDRIYLNHLIKLVSNDTIKEGRNYQCVFYGGRLLARLEATTDPDSAEVNILTVNRNAVLVMDSDKSKEADEINDTKKRMTKEVEDAGGLVWTTLGREIENYIPQPSLAKHFDNPKQPALGQYEKLSEYLDKNTSGAGNKFLSNKNGFASDIIEKITLEDIKGHLDLLPKTLELVNRICEWNHLDRLT